MVKPCYTCRTVCEVSTLFFMVRSQSPSQPDIGALSRNSDLRLTRILHPPVHIVFFSTAQEGREGFLFFLEKCIFIGWFAKTLKGLCFLRCVGVSTPHGILMPPHHEICSLLSPSIDVVVGTSNTRARPPSPNWKMNSELYCRGWQLTKISLPKLCLDRFTALRATALMAWKANRMVLKRKIYLLCS